MTVITTPTADFVTSSLSGALAVAASTATIGTGLSLPATNGVLQIDYNEETIPVGTDNGPETILYAAYDSGTGALTGITRGIAGTTDVAHASGAEVQLGFSTYYFKNTFIGARAYLNATLGTTVSNQATKVALDAETYDVGGNFANGKFTAPVNGYYSVQAAIYYQSADTGKYYSCQVAKNGTAVMSTTIGYVTSTAGGPTVTANDTIYLDAGQYLELYYLHDGATTVDIYGGGSTFLTVCLVKEV